MGKQRRLGMRKHVLLTALLVAACAKEPEAFKPLVLTASPEETTKSFLNGTTVCWSDGDAVAAYVGGVSYPSSSTLITGRTVLSSLRSRPPSPTVLPTEPAFPSPAEAESRLRYSATSADSWRFPSRPRV